jgi:hypothetical protein
MTENNPYLRHKEQVHQAKLKYNESEMLLNLLRTSKPTKPPTEQEILEWKQKLH